MKCLERAWKYKQGKNSRNFLPYLNQSFIQFPTPKNTRWALMLLSHLAFGAGRLKWSILDWWNKYLYSGEKKRTKLDANKAWHCKQGGSPHTERGTWRGWELPESSFSQSNPKSGKYGIKKQTLPKAQRTRGLSSSCQSNFLRLYHKSWSHFIFRIPTKHQL